MAGATPKMGGACASPAGGASTALDLVHSTSGVKIAAIDVTVAMVRFVIQ